MARKPEALGLDGLLKLLRVWAPINVVTESFDRKFFFGTVP